MTESNVTRAMDLWDRLHSLFQATQDTIEAIIHEKAWEPLGYSSFSEAWTDKMSDITIASELRPHVIYQMIAEGLDNATIAGTVKGAGPVRVEAMRRQRGNGVPATDATGRTVVSRHLRQKPSPSSTLHIEIGETRYVEYQRIAKGLNMTIEEIALQAITEFFKKLA